MRILILGAGIVGLSSAWWLSRDGHEVTVLDREAEVGRGTSFANGAQLSYSYVAPMASRAVLAGAAKYLLDRNSPIRFVPAADPAQWQWTMAFLRACNADAGARATARLLALAAHSRAALADMLARDPMAFDHRVNGKLVVQSSRAGMAQAEGQLALQAGMGSEQQALTAAECLALEPSLASIERRLVGGVLTPSEAMGDCRKLCEELYRVLADRVAFRLGLAADGLLRRGGRVVGVVTSAGAIEADATVLAAGPASRLLGRGAGLRLLVQPIRGYSITARVRDAARAPVRSITDIARKTVFAPLADTLRVAGFAEIGTAAQPLRADRISSLAETLATTFPGACELQDLHPWMGLRPATPTDVPLIGPSRQEGLLLNLGHGSLGFTLAAGSGKLLADLVAGRSSGLDPAAYTPGLRSH